MFQAAFPERFINVGIQEANLVGVASGLAACGKIPFISSFASFLVCTVCPFVVTLANSTNVR
jgi:transketolase